MANELNYFGTIEETGLSVTAKVYDSSGAQVGSDISCVEAGSLAIYKGNMPAASLGQYGVRFFSGTTLLGQGEINWDGSGECELNLVMPIANPWAEVIESGYTAAEVLRLLAAVSFGKTNIVDLGGGSATVTFRNLADTKDRVDADMIGSERSTVTLDAT